MEENGGKWGNSGHSTRDVGRGGLWRDVVDEKGTKMGEKWDEIPIFHSPISPFSRRSKIFPIVPSVKMSTAHSLTENGNYWTH